MQALDASDRLEETDRILAVKLIGPVEGMKDLSYRFTSFRATFIIGGVENV